MLIPSFIASIKQKLNKKETNPEINYNPSSGQTTRDINLPLYKKPLILVESFIIRWKKLPVYAQLGTVLIGFLALSLIIAMIYLTISGAGLSLITNLTRTIGGLKDTSQKDTDGFVKLVIPEREPPFFTLTPVTKRPYGILPQEKLTLKAKEKVSLDFIKQHLVASVPVEIISSSDNIYVIIPNQPLDIDQSIQIKLAVEDQQTESHTFDRDYSWSYQMQGKFRIKSSIPGDEKIDVPVNTGIELTFSQDDYKDPAPLISIEPKINYRIERHSDTIAIVPLQPLNFETTYTVTLKKGLGLESRIDPITEDFTFSFQTEQEKKPEFSAYLDTNTNIADANTTQPPVIKVFTSNWKEEKVKAQIYQYSDSQSFIKSREKIDQAEYGWQRYFPDYDSISTTGLSLVSTVDLNVERKDENYSHIEYLKLPAALPAGLYLVQLSYGNEGKAFAWVQVTDLSGYISVGERQTTVWLNKLSDGQPAKQASVKLSPDVALASANDQGVAVFNTPNQSSSTYIESTSLEGQKLLLPAIFKKQSETLKKDDFWTYLYNERSLYLPTDTLYFWGIAKNKDTGQIPANLEISLQSSRYSYSSATAPIAVKTIVPQSDGTFLGQISFTDLPTGWYYLSVQSNKTELGSTSMQVIEYEKPEMKIDLSSSKKAIFSHESNLFTGQVSFYDLTPASQLPLRIYGEHTSVSADLKADKQGKFSYNYQPKDSPAYPGSYHCLTVTPSSVNQAKIESNSCVYVLNYQLLLEAQTSQNEDQAFLKAITSNISLDNFNKDGRLDFKGNNLPNQTITFEVTKEWWDMVEKGTYYDFVEKVTRPAYEYTQRTEKWKPVTKSTNQNGEADYQFTMEDKKSYTVTVSTLDKNHKTITQTYYFYYYKDAQTGYRRPESSLELNFKSNWRSPI